MFWAFDNKQGKSPEVKFSEKSITRNFYFFKVGRETYCISVQLFIYSSTNLCKHYAHVIFINGCIAAIRNTSCIYKLCIYHVSICSLNSIFIWLKFEKLELNLLNSKSNIYLDYCSLQLWKINFIIRAEIEAKFYFALVKLSGLCLSRLFNFFRTFLPHKEIS